MSKGRKRGKKQT